MGLLDGRGRLCNLADEPATETATPTSLPHVGPQAPLTPATPDEEATARILASLAEVERELALTKERRRDDLSRERELQGQVERLIGLLDAAGKRLAEVERERDERDRAVADAAIVIRDLKAERDRYRSIDADDLLDQLRATFDAWTYAARGALSNEGG